MQFTKEQLIAQAEGNITIMRGCLAHIRDGFERNDIAADLRLAEIALAAMQQEQLYQVLNSGGWRDVKGDIFEALKAEGLNTRILYTAPPVPVMPDEITFEKIAEITASQGYEYSINECICAASWWNACRAAMLQGKAEHVSNRDELNSPVVPDGWISCSERMPEEDGNYWGWWSECKRQGPVWFTKSDSYSYFQSSEITHWMPLPAAPRQEV
ncbi:uncharacterized protein DUF551 [Yokenella regensburgei]|uniref:Uncharacterized protein DUF551 n=1 Tax=Yokenella regensburgei TaxID=158877 RepID=A0ABX9S0G3_9ENTR|nr:DUF551 domain-containing protein [Yokenella regensburgei]RKR64006.1 uncharacterized protein DUF551 [Yokenella regensburgei]VFS25631.1 Protein of uncharacterised function (DUF551) [Yokenella regensburgei]